MSQKRHSDRKQYFEELAITSQKYFIPYIAQFHTISNDDKVLEIGCGDGGNLLPFARLGCSVTGIDLSGNKILSATRLFKESSICGSFYENDFLSDSLNFGGQFDIIIIHDVIEHIAVEHKLIFMIKVKKLLKPTGVVFWGFPAWQMPFGGHQQICQNRIGSHMPYIHLLPTKLYSKILRIFGENESTIEELNEIKRSKMTVESFELFCKQAGLIIMNRTLWFVNPHYEVKFKLHPIKLGRFIAQVPYFRNLFSTSCFYITN